MTLTNAYPAVCSVLGSNKFALEAGVSPIERSGPANGANACFTFALTDVHSEANVGRPKRATRRRANDEQHKTCDLHWTDALVLISCVKSKLSHRAPARELYISTQFAMSRELADAQGADIMILSARYGLVEPTREIEPYDYTLNTLGVRERREWAAAVLNDLLPLAKRKGRVVLLAGERYREFLIQPLQRNGIVVEVPMQGLRQGEQLAWLAGHR